MRKNAGHRLAGVNVRHRARFAYLDAVLPDGAIAPLCRCATAARQANGDLRSTAPATTTTKTPSYPAATPSAPHKKPSTAPAASTSKTPPPGPKPPTNKRAGALRSLAG